MASDIVCLRDSQRRPQTSPNNTRCSRHPDHRGCRRVPACRLDSSISQDSPGGWQDGREATKASSSCKGSGGSGACTSVAGYPGSSSGERRARHGSGQRKMKKTSGRDRTGSAREIKRHGPQIPGRGLCSPSSWIRPNNRAAPPRRIAAAAEKGGDARSSIVTNERARGHGLAE